MSTSVGRRKSFPEANGMAVPRSPESAPRREKDPELRLTDGSRVAVIGGGPAGSFFSYFLLAMADQAVSLGEATYLDMAAIWAIAEQAGCDAIHPGYGFLSERAELGRMCEEEGIVFIGPTVAQLEAVGDKVFLWLTEMGKVLLFLYGASGDDAVFPLCLQKCGCACWVSQRLPIARLTGMMWHGQVANCHAEPA